MQWNLPGHCYYLTCEPKDETTNSHNMKIRRTFLRLSFWATYDCWTECSSISRLRGAVCVRIIAPSCGKGCIERLLLMLLLCVVLVALFTLACIVLLAIFVVIVWTVDLFPVAVVSIVIVVLIAHVCIAAPIAILVLLFMFSHCSCVCCNSPCYILLPLSILSFLLFFFLLLLLLFLLLLSVLLFLLLLMLLCVL
jgi:hypothetical protein